MKKLSLCAAILSLTLVANSRGALIITEAMSSSNNTASQNDWFELTNTGASALNITGYKVDDNSFDFSLSVALEGVTSIAAGESVVFLETKKETSAAADLAAFRSIWWGAAPSSVQVGYYFGSGVSLGAGGDGLEVFDSAGNSITGQVTFGASAAGVSFGYDPTQLPNQSGFGSPSVAGSNGAFTSFTTANVPVSDVGSPGAIPEPSTYALLLSAGGVTFVVLRRKRTQPGLI